MLDLPTLTEGGADMQCYADKLARLFTKCQAVMELLGKVVRFWAVLDRWLFVGGGKSLHM